MKRFLLMLFISMLGFISLYADDNDFNPTNPPDPSGDFKYKITVTASPAGSTSGTGRYLPGAQVTIRTSAADQYYHFSHWLKDGEVYEAEQEFTYTTEAKSVKFVAVYEYVFDPGNPEDPQENFKYTLQLTSSDPEACSYNMAAKTRQMPNTSVYVCCYPNNGYTFLGWYEGETLLTTSTWFYYTMPQHNATLEARFSDFNPDSPEDPDSQGGDIHNFLLGDANGDREVNIGDVMSILNHIVGNTPAIFNATAADANHDQEVNIGDVLTTFNIIVNQ